MPSCDDILNIGLTTEYADWWTAFWLVVLGFALVMMYRTHISESAGDLERRLRKEKE